MTTQDCGTPATDIEPSAKRTPPSKSVEVPRETGTRISSFLGDLRLLFNYSPSRNPTLDRISLDRYGTREPGF